MAEQGWFHRCWARITAAPLATANQILFPGERRFQVGRKVLVVRPLMIADCQRLWGQIQVLIGAIVRDHPDLDLENQEQMLQVITPIIARSLGTICQDLWGMEPDYLAQHTSLLQASAIARALVEVNQLPEILKNVSGALQHVKAASELLPGLTGTS